MDTTDISAMTDVSNERHFVFKLSRIGTARDSADGFARPFRCPFNQIIWITNGSGICRIDMEKYKISTNTLFMIPPGRIRHIEAVDEISGYVLSFNTDFLYLSTDGPGRLFFEEVAADINNIIMVSLNADPILLHNVLLQMEKEVGNSMILRLEILSGLMKLFLIYMKRASNPIRRQFESTQNMRLYNQFNSKLEKNFLTKRTVAEL
jgi:AraC family transcriptional activator of pobA